jgi:hypothetical protein
LVVVLATAIASLTVPQVLAAGGETAYNNSTGDPPADTYQTPYANAGDGRMLIFCAEDPGRRLTGCHLHPCCRVIRRRAFGQAAP